MKTKTTKQAPTMWTELWQLLLKASNAEDRGRPVAKHLRGARRVLDEAIAAAERRSA